MSGGSQHNPNGRQSQLGPGWSPLQMANFLVRAPQAHMASDRGHTWHTPTPPPHLYHVPVPSPPDPLQAMKAVGSNSVFRHTATPPELYRHTPTPPDKHLIRHTPSPGDIKAGAVLPPVELYPHLGPGRDKLVRAEELLAYARVGVDLSLSGARSAANGAAPAPAALSAPSAPAPAALSVRDAPTINSLIARATPRAAHARVDALLERLVPSPASPHSVIVHSRAAPTPSPPSSNEDSADSCGAPPGSKRKRKPERTLRVPSIPLPPMPLAPAPPAARLSPPPPQPAPVAAPAPAPASRPVPLENGDAAHEKRNGPDERPPSPRPPEPHARRKSRSGSAETIADIAAMIAGTDGAPLAPPLAPPPPLVTVAKLESVLASPESAKPPEPEPDAGEEERPPEPAGAGPAAAPRRRSARVSNSEATNVPVESPSEAKPAEPEASGARSAEPTAASFVEVENQLEKMFAGLEEEPRAGSAAGQARAPPDRKRRKSAPGRGARGGDAAARGAPARGARGDDRRKAARKKSDATRPRKSKDAHGKDAYDSGSNASSSRSRGPYIQIVGARDSPLSVCVMNAAGAVGATATAAGSEEETPARRKGEEFRNGARALHAAARGLHASTLGLRYDATTPDATWLCVFCQRGPHADHLGDLFGPYTIDTDCEEFRSLDEASRRRYTEGSRALEVWLHEACGVWAPGVVAAGARVWGLARAVWAARAARCAHCALWGAPLACAQRACRAAAHLPCARAARWALCADRLRALCPAHRPV